MYVLGIDPGGKGAFCVLDEGGFMMHCQAMPSGGVGGVADEDNILPIFNALYELKAYYPDLKCAIEEAFALNSSSAMSILTYGEHNGYLKCALKTIGIPFIKVLPRVWQADLHKGTNRFTNAKDRSYEAAGRLWPAEKFHSEKSARRKNAKPHDGMVDSALIAEWGRCQYRMWEQEKEREKNVVAVTTQKNIL